MNVFIYKIYKFSINLVLPLLSADGFRFGHKRALFPRIRRRWEFPLVIKGPKPKVMMGWKCERLSSTAESNTDHQMTAIAFVYFLRPDFNSPNRLLLIFIVLFIDQLMFGGEFHNETWVINTFVQNETIVNCQTYLCVTFFTFVWHAAWMSKKD